MRISQNIIDAVQEKVIAFSVKYPRDKDKGLNENFAEPALCGINALFNDFHANTAEGLFEIALFTIESGGTLTAYNDPFDLGEVLLAIANLYRAAEQKDTVKVSHFGSFLVSVLLERSGLDEAKVFEYIHHRSQ